MTSQNKTRSRRRTSLASVFVFMLHILYLCL